MPERLDEVLDASGRDAQHVRLLDHREQRPLGAPAGLEQRREVASRRAPAGSTARGVPTRVSQRRSRYPLRLVSRRSGSRSPLGTPVSSVTSASITAWASTRTPSRRKSTSPSVIALRTVSSTAILSSAIVVSLRVVGSYSNDARMTRWPFPFPATAAVTPSLGTRPCGDRHRARRPRIWNAVNGGGPAAAEHASWPTQPTRSGPLLEPFHQSPLNWAANGAGGPDLRPGVNSMPRSSALDRTEPASAGN